MNEHIVFFDGDCAMCNQWVQFILRRDRIGVMKFASLQSDYASRVLGQIRKITTKSDITTIVYWRKNRIYDRSEAVIMIIGDMGYPWSLAKFFMIFPAFVRDGFYDFVSRHRHSVIKKKNHCVLLTPDENKRVLS